MENKFEKLLKEYSDEKLQKILQDKQGYVEDFRIAAAIELNKRNPDFNSDEYKSEVEKSRKEIIASNNSIYDHDRDKYPTLSGISVAFKILAWVNILVSFVAIGVIASKSIELGFPIIIAMIFYTVVSFILLFAVSEIIKLFIDIEKNTRMKKS